MTTPSLSPEHKALLEAAEEYRIAKAKWLHGTRFGEAILVGNAVDREALSCAEAALAYAASVREKGK